MQRLLYPAAFGTAENSHDHVRLKFVKAVEMQKIVFGLFFKLSTERISIHKVSFSLSRISVPQFEGLIP